MTSESVFGPQAWALAAMLAVLPGLPAAGEALPTTPQVSPQAEAPSAPRPRRLAGAEAPLPPLCDGPGRSQLRRVLFNHAELDDPAAEPALQSAVQLCISAAPARNRASTRGPLWRG